MKMLSILRHAKSSWEHNDLDDIDRPILEKGKLRTKKVCKFMIDKALKPDRILSSPAKRALQTATIVIEELKQSLTPEINKNLYPGRVDDIVKAVAALSNQLQHVMVVGHNPVFTDLAMHLCNNFTIDWLPTSGVIIVEFDIDNWQNIANTKGTCKHCIKPKEL